MAWLSGREAAETRRLWRMRVAREQKRWLTVTTERRSLVLREDRMLERSWRVLSEACQ
jgi:hypothetical protein